MVVKWLEKPVTTGHQTHADVQLVHGFYVMLYFQDSFIFLMLISLFQFTYCTIQICFFKHSVINYPRSNNYGRSDIGLFLVFILVQVQYMFTCSWIGLSRLLRQYFRLIFFCCLVVSFSCDIVKSLFSSETKNAPSTTKTDNFV